MRRVSVQRPKRKRPEGVPSGLDRLGCRLVLTSPPEGGFQRGLGTPSSSSRFAAAPTQERSTCSNGVFHRQPEGPSTLARLLPGLKARVSGAEGFR